MHAGKYLPGLIATLAVLPAHAQQTTPSPAPTRAPPTITTLPGAIPEHFSIAAPTPAPTAAPAPTPTPTPVAATGPAATPVSRAPVRGPVERVPAPQALPAPIASSTPTAAPSAAPVQPQIVASPVPVQAPPPAAQPRPWIWGLIGAGGTVAIALAGWLFLRRRRPDAEEPVAEPVPPAAAPPPVKSPSPRIAAPPPVSSEPFEVQVQPVRIQIGEREVVIDLVLTITNTSGGAADAVRLSAAGISASPRQDAHIASFQGSAQFAASAPPFDLLPGTGGQLPVQIMLPRTGLHIVDLGGHPMFVPIVAIDLRWRGGLSIRSFATSFMLGTSGQSGKIGPVWLDRGQPRGPFAASRYLMREAAAA